MKKFRVSLVGVAFFALIGLVVLFLIRLTLHRPPEIVLPSTDAAESADVVSEADPESIHRVEVTPETVQLMIEQMSRPACYRCTFSIERYWESGKGESTVEVRVSGGWMQIDTLTENVPARHVVTGDGEVWIWYGSGERVYHGPASFSPDEEQGIPTYEDILRWDMASIAAADYRMLDSMHCVFVETAQNASGYTERYWVETEHGLLAAAERLYRGTVVYRMSCLAIEAESDNTQPFELPDGEILYQPDAD